MYQSYLEEINNPTYLKDEEMEKKLALAINLQLVPENGQTLKDFLSQVEADDNAEYFTADGGEYLVLTNDEADVRWDEYLDQYIYECIIPEMPEHLQSYFDYEGWKSDARMDGRGHCLSSYDGNEDYETINGTEYYIYRTN